jgi:hypothetical protein
MTDETSAQHVNRRRFLVGGTTALATTTLAASTPGQVADAGPGEPPTPSAAPAGARLFRLDERGTALFPMLPPHRGNNVPGLVLAGPDGTDDLVVKQVQLLDIDRIEDPTARPTDLYELQLRVRLRFSWDPNAGKEEPQWGHAVYDLAFVDATGAVEYRVQSATHTFRNSPEFGGKGYFSEDVTLSLGRLRLPLPVAGWISGKVVADTGPDPLLRGGH